jgi:hypothetical protein
VPTPTPEPEPISAGELLWLEHNCADCHGTIGDGQPDNGRSLVNALIHGTTVNKIKDDMPKNDPTACDLTCAQEITLWLNEVNIIAASIPSGSALQVTQRAAASKQVLLERLYKASMNILSIVPKQSWIDLVQNQGATGFSQVIDQIMTEDNFYRRVRDIYQTFIASENTPSVSYLKNFPNHQFEWHAQFSGETAAFAKKVVYDTIEDEALNLIDNIVRKDRPFTEIFTADYIMMNYFSAVTYNVPEQTIFEAINNPLHAEIPYDENELKEVKITAFPMAGILTSWAFLDNYPTTATNINRHRAYKIYQLFLDTDILTIDGSAISSISTGDVIFDNPTLNNPTCTGCHNIIDPVASTFRHWQIGSEYSHDQYNWSQEGILLPGFNGEESTKDNTDTLPWLANKLADDRRFALSTVKRLFPAFTTQGLLPLPGKNADEQTYLLYNHQQEVLNKFADDFIASGYMVKDLVKALIMSDYFTGESYLGSSTTF